MKYMILTTIISSILISCEPDCRKKGGHDSILFKNNSNRNIEVKIVDNYPDTILYETYNPLNDQGSYIPPNSHWKIGSSGPQPVCFEKIYGEGNSHWFYVFDYDSLITLSWDTVRITGRGILERRKVDLNYLIQQNFTFVYEE